MSATQVLFDEPGPRARRRILIGTVASTLAIIGVLVWATLVFAHNGQLAAAKWKPFIEPGIPKYIAKGLLNTLEVTVVSAVVAFPAGALLALMRLARNRAVRWVATGYIELFRSTPLLLLVFIFVGALPPLGINPSTFWKITIPVIVVNAAILAEVFRAGVRALPRGQGEAASSVGLTYWQSMRLVILPQAFRIIIPALVTQLVSLLKDSTLGYAASFPELMKTATNLTSFYHNFIQSYLVVAFIFIAMNLMLSYFARVLDRRLHRQARGRAVDIGGDTAAPSEVLEVTEAGAALR